MKLNVNAIIKAYISEFNMTTQEIGHVRKILRGFYDLYGNKELPPVHATLIGNAVKHAIATTITLRDAEES